MLGAPYYPESQGAIEAFNKYIQSFLYKAYDNVSKSNEEEKKKSLKETWNLDLVINSFILLQLKKEAYNNRIYSSRSIL